jgi:hypothetical protein
MSEWVLRLEGEGPVRSLGLNGVREEPGRYFGGADMDDMWFAKDAASACRFKSRPAAMRAAAMYGLMKIRVWIPEELPEGT